MVTEISSLLEVWLLLLVSCIIIMCVIGVMDLHFSPELSKRRRKERFYRIFWVYWAAIFKEGSMIPFYTAPHRLVLGSWLLGTMIIMNTFVCYMESTLMVKSETFRINEVDQLIKRREIKPMIYDVGGYKSIYQVRSTMPSRRRLFSGAGISVKCSWVCRARQVPFVQ